MRVAWPHWAACSDQLARAARRPRCTVARPGDPACAPRGRRHVASSRARCALVAARSGRRSGRFRRRSWIAQAVHDAFGRPPEREGCAGADQHADLRSTATALRKLYSPPSVHTTAPGGGHSSPARNGGVGRSAGCRGRVRSAPARMLHAVAARRRGRGSRTGPRRPLARLTRSSTRSGSRSTSVAGCAQYAVLPAGRRGRRPAGGAALRDRRCPGSVPRPGGAPRLASRGGGPTQPRGTRRPLRRARGGVAEPQASAARRPATAAPAPARSAAAAGRPRAGRTAPRPPGAGGGGAPACGGPGRRAARATPPAR